MYHAFHFHCTSQWLNNQQVSPLGNPSSLPTKYIFSPLINLGTKRDLKKKKKEYPSLFRKHAIPHFIRSYPHNYINYPLSLIFKGHSFHWFLIFMESSTCFYLRNSNCHHSIQVGKMQEVLVEWWNHPRFPTSGHITIP